MVLIVIGVISLIMTKCRPSLVIIIVAIIGLLINNGTLDISLQRYGVSANRSISALKSDSTDENATSRTSTTGNEKQLKATLNPVLQEQQATTDQQSKATLSTASQKEQAISTTAATDSHEVQKLKQTSNPQSQSTTAHADASDTNLGDKADLKQTKNPRLQGADQQTMPQSQAIPTTNVGGKDYIFSQMNISAYTPEGYQRRYEELKHNGKETFRQTSEQHARHLNSLYMDLISETSKKDPYLQGKDSTGCDLIKGRIKPVQHYDC